MFIFTEYICSLASAKGGGRENRPGVELKLRSNGNLSLSFLRRLNLKATVYRGFKKKKKKKKKRAIADTSVYVQYPYVYVYPIVYTRREASIHHVIRSAVLNQKD